MIRVIEFALTMWLRYSARWLSTSPVLASRGFDVGHVQCVG